MYSYDGMGMLQSQWRLQELHNGFMEFLEATVIPIHFILNPSSLIPVHVVGVSFIIKLLLLYS